MSNHESYMVLSATSQDQMMRLQKNIYNMNPVGVRTTYSDLPCSDFETEIGVYDITFGVGVIVRLTEGGLGKVHLVTKDNDWTPEPETSSNSFTITPSIKYGTANMSSYDLITTICHVWPTRVEWLNDLRVQLYPSQTSSV